MKKILLAMFLFGFVFSIANPASVYCEELGYETVFAETDEGVAGMCRLPGGEEVDEWAFFRGEVAQEYSYCVKEGYGIKTITEEMDGWTAVYAVCILEDESEVPITDLMNLSVGGAISGEEPAAGTEEEAGPGAEEEPLPEANGGPAGETQEEETEPANEEPAVVAPVGGVTKLPNPASAYCKQQGGTLEIKKDAQGGEYGECTLPDGTVCEEWALYKRECGPGAVAHEEPLPWTPIIVVLLVLVLVYWFFLRK